MYDDPIESFMRYLEGWLEALKEEGSKDPAFPSSAVDQIEILCDRITEALDDARKSLEA